MIEFQNIEFSYHNNPILYSISGKIQKGDFVVLVGPNGSGKSTLIKCINKILKIQKGNILIDNKNINLYSPNELSRKIAYVPQNETRRQETNVFDTVLMGRKPYINWKPSASDLEFTSGILKLLDIENLSMKKVNELSGGQHQIVMIARALAQEPEILLLDEPTANLDLKHQLEVMELLKKLSEKGITILLAIHDINMAIRYSTHIMMLKKGKIFAYGDRKIINLNNLEKLYDVQIEIIAQKDNLYIIPTGLPK